MEIKCRSVGPLVKEYESFGLGTGMEIKSRSVGPLVKGKRTVASRLGWRDSGHRTLETLIQFVKFVKRGQVTPSLGMEYESFGLGTRHSPKPKFSLPKRRSSP